MAELHDRRASAAGFTLAEMMVALAILLIGVTAVLSALGDGLVLRRTSEGRIGAGLLAQDVLHRIRSEAIKRKADAQTALDLELVALTDQPAPGVPGTTWSVTFAEDENRPGVVLATIKVRWLEQGDAVQQEFLAVVPKSEPFAARVQRWRADNGQSR